MDEVMKKRISIGIAVGCITLAVIITVVTNRSGSGLDLVPSGSVPLLCTNPQCGNIFEMSAKDLQRNSDEQGSTSGPPAYKCPKCGQMSAYNAMKCEKCGNVFIPNYQSDVYDKCPKCGYSKYEEAEKKAK